MIKTASDWDRLPFEMKQYPQWCIAGPDKSPMAANKDGSLYPIGVTEDWRPHWMSFHAASTVAAMHGYHIGFILHKDDPFTCVDFDVKDVTNEPDPSKWTPPEHLDNYWSMVKWLDSYTETSRGGKGLHTWVKGKIGRGLRKHGIEVYSQDRYIISTGRVIIEQSIADRQDKLNMLISAYRTPDDVSQELVELAEDESDEVIIERAMSADNAEKFNQLCSGNWQAYNFPSQSEADLALMSMFTFYSKSNEQCRRLFRMTALGKRDKAVKDDRYLNFTLKLIRGRQAREAQVEVHAVKQSAETVMKWQQERMAQEEIARLQGTSAELKAVQLHVPTGTDSQLYTPPAAASFTLAGPVSERVVAESGKGLEWPPGMAGAIASFVYESSPRPVKEVAIMTTLGLLAGICGKAWSIPGSGLNMYGILVARSAVGKEAMHSGMSALISAVASRQPAAMNFVDFSDFASGPALVKATSARPCFVNVAGEFGRKLRRMSADDRESPMTQLRTVMTNLYQKSGPSSIVGGITYSNAEANIASVSGVSYSMIGETTPGTLYESMTSTMMEDGFLSRFVIIEYDGLRPPLNTNPVQVPSKALGDALADLCVHALTLMDQRKTVSLGRTDEAAIIMKDFELECDNEINATDDESWRQMWNRASLKMMRIAALLAVADNWLHPVLEKHHVEWALTVIRHGIQVMTKRLETGDVGNTDDARDKKVLSLFAEYLDGPVSPGYKIPEDMRKNGIIPKKFLQNRLANTTSFNNHRLGGSGALDMVLRSLADAGYIMEVEKGKMVDAYNFHGKCFRILTMPDFTHMKARRKAK